LVFKTLFNEGLCLILPIVWGIFLYSHHFGNWAHSCLQVIIVILLFLFYLFSFMMLDHLVDLMVSVLEYYLKCLGFVPNYFSSWIEWSKLALHPVNYCNYEHFRFFVLYLLQMSVFCHIKIIFFSYVNGILCISLSPNI
jgi:hypothetical protein